MYYQVWGDKMKWKIGNVEIDNQVVLAPMAGITNTTFRSICKSMGAGLVVGEMVSDKGKDQSHNKFLVVIQNRWEKLQK